MLPEEAPRWPDQQITHCHPNQRRRALWPHRTDQIQPAFQFFPELARPGVIDASELADQAEVANSGMRSLPRSVKQR